MWIETVRLTNGMALHTKFIRQQWRMWIETSKWTDATALLGKFIRQQWRMWIETVATVVAEHSDKTIHSPAMANVD